jgi:hypothetical protein
MGKLSGSGFGIRIRDEQPGSNLKNNFWVKILKFFDVDPGSGMEKNSDPGSGMEKRRIRDPG